VWSSIVDVNEILPEETERRDGGLRYLRSLPETSYPYDRARVGIFDLRGEGTEGEYHPMEVTNLTGWRWWRNPGGAPNEVGVLEGLNYHFGVDYVPQGSPRYGTPISAPESGAVWVYEHHARDNPTIRFDDENGLVLSNYEAGAYGNAVVLVTEPELPRTGRVYLFFHVRADSVLDGLAHRYGQSPTSYEEAVWVDAGGWIGVTDDHGAEDAPHVHLEVYEFFPGGEMEEHATPDDRERLDGGDEEPAIGEENFNWQRVDPQSVFDPEHVEIINQVGANPRNRVIDWAAERGVLGLDRGYLESVYFRRWSGEE